MITNTSSVLFKCKTSEGYYIKILSELLTNNLKNGCFVVNQKGIFLKMFDQPRKTLVDLKLFSEKFNLYKFKLTTKFSIGINLNHFYKILKSIKKKDSLEIIIDSDNNNELSIVQIPKENTRRTTSTIKIQNIQNLNIVIPAGYTNPVIIQSSDFQKMCKELSSIGSNNIKVAVRTYHVDFIANADGIMKRHVRLGENEESEDEEKEKYVGNFTVDQISRITKLAGLSTIIQLYTATSDLPLLFKSSIGNTGEISLYIKSLEITEMEMESAYSDDEL